MIAGLIAYTYRDKLPSLNLRPVQIKMLKGLPSDRYVELTLNEAQVAAVAWVVSAAAWSARTYALLNQFG